VYPDDAGVLVRLAADGDEAAWAMLVKRFSGLVWSVARAYGLGFADAEEVFQTTWLRLAEHVGRLKEPDRVGAWLATTARHETFKMIRAGKRTSPTDDLDRLDRGDDVTPETLALEAEEATTEAARARQVWAAFQQLPARCRELLRVLMATPPLPYVEVAEMFGIAVGSIGPTRGRCLHQLRALLAGSEAGSGPAGGSGRLEGR
jgi:RNA polymerase sigma factor (sigma-70 family)